MAVVKKSKLEYESFKTEQFEYCLQNKKITHQKSHCS